MNRSIIFLAATVGFASLISATASADNTKPSTAQEARPMMGGEHRAKIREEIRLHEQRARELDPIIARDRQARHDVEVDWVVLERHARELHARANEFRTYASEVVGRAQEDMNRFGNELDTFAQHDEENATVQHEVAERLDRVIQNEVQTREWHIQMAQRLRGWLDSNGG